MVCRGAERGWRGEILHAEDGEEGTKWRPAEHGSIKLVMKTISLQGGRQEITSSTECACVYRTRFRSLR